MIQNFRHKGLKMLLEKGDRRKVPAEHAAKIQRVLTRLNRSGGPEEMNVAGFRTHALTGNLAGFWSVAVSGNRRVIFRFEKGHARDVDPVGYH